MALMLGCAVLVGLGLLAVVRWGGLEVQPPSGDQHDAGCASPAAVRARRYLRGVVLGAGAGLGSGVLMGGAGGRLAMRLLAATAGGPAQGRRTEAEEVVGRISFGGTVGFVVFASLFFGLASGIVYLAVRRWLPGGRLGGLAYGVLLLVAVAPRVDPLRADNPDFDIVGPGPLALVVFAALVVMHGMLVAALAGRYSRTIPLLSRRPGAVAAHAPLLLLLPMAPALVVLAAAGTAVVGLGQIPAVAAGLRSRAAGVAARAVILAAGLVALPGFVTAAVDIAGRGP